MIKNLLIFVLMFLTIACKESVIEPPDNSNSSDFFPNADGNSYQFNISVYDSSGLLTSGIRKSYFRGDTLLLMTPYQKKVDTMEINNNISVNQSYFRKSISGIFNYSGIDTAGFSALIPDSLRGAISFDSEYRLIYQPLSIGQKWPVYKVKVDLVYIDFDFFIVDAEVIARDSITFSYRNSTLTKEVYQIEYVAKLFTDFNSPPVKFAAFSWIAQDIGVVKWEGDSELINFFAGANIYPQNSLILEELASFEIR